MRARVSTKKTGPKHQRTVSDWKAAARWLEQNCMEFRPRQPDDDVERLVREITKPVVTPCAVRRRSER